ncbi:hypothetical protein B9Z65_5503 [Elsinoe australis]|uniref:Uncharacterized protein n=1 Tax=Elsinoe australis TaxID=40998 RepID=A0A2P7ZE90_9PEZI|nr:hypothetical protein B9Z65_5503 [Elsinoe australis]
MPNFAGILMHAATLRILSIYFLQGLDPEEIIPSIDDLQQICRTCQALRQFSCAFPPTPLAVGAISSNWCEFARTIAMLPHLITLQITTWPEGQQNHWGEENMTCIEALARRVFQEAESSALSRSNTHSLLRLVGFGPCDVPDQSWDCDIQMTFIRWTQKAPGADAAPIERVSRHTWMAEEPESEVLERFINFHIQEFSDLGEDIRQTRLQQGMKAIQGTGC